MKVCADAIVTNEYNEALFIRRGDTRTWAPPGGALESGELPTAAVVREVEEETGLKVMPARLVGVYYRWQRPDGFLLFSFRCLQRGGELRPSSESLQVGFLPAVPLPAPMLGIHREHLQRALRHYGGPPYWGSQRQPALWRLARWLVYRLRDARAVLRGEAPYQPPRPWHSGAFVVIRDETGRGLWVKRKDHAVWNLPGGRSSRGETPWATATRETREETGLNVRLVDLTGVYVKPERNHLVFTFTAEITGGRLTPNAEAADFAYFASGTEPANSLPKHVERVADAVSPQGRTIFRVQRGESDLAALAAEEGV